MTYRFLHKLKTLKLPGHSFSSQVRFSLIGPLQYLPPYLGGGELHFLSLYCTPPPQDTVQIEYSDHFPNPPFTGHGLIEHSRI